LNASLLAARNLTDAELQDLAGIENALGVERALERAH
jgi:hypothetical protein